MFDLTRETLKNIIYMARRFKMATALNMLGLIVAFAAFYIFMTQILHQVTFNHGIKDYKRLYRLESNFVYNEMEFSDIVCRPFADALQRMPEVESYSLVDCVNSYPQLFKRTTTGQGVEYPLTLANNQAVSSLSHDAVNGSIEWSDSDMDGYIIPRSFALDYFGTIDVQGKEMIGIYEGEEFRPKVRGVYEDFPKNSDIPNFIYMNMGDMDTFSLNACYKCIVKFKTIPDDMDDFVNRYKQCLIDYMKEGFEKEGKAHLIAIDVQEIKLTNFRFTPVKSSYFERTSLSSGERGYKIMVYVLGLASLLAIVLAAINFLNFTLAESPMRIRGLNTRRVLGASRKSIRLGLICEGVVTAVTACLLSFIVCRMFQHLPATRHLTEGNPALTAHPWLVLIMLITAVAVGVIASAYPCICATSFPLAMTLKGNFGLTPRGHSLRKILVGLQLGISFLMVIYIGILFAQTRFIFNSPYGYDKENLLMAKLPPNYTDYTLDNDTLHQVLSKLPGVQEVAFAEEQLGQTDGHSTVWTSYNNEVFKYTIIHTSPNYLSTLGIKMIEGRGFEPGDTAAIIINRAARKQWPWIHFGSVLSTSTSEDEPDSAVVVGVFDDIRYGTTRINKDKPFLIVYKQDYPYLNSVMLRVAPDADHTTIKQQVNALLTQLYGTQYRPAAYFDEMLSYAYESELRFVNQMVMLSIICIIITLIGAFCMTIFETEYRRKEIGIRKVAGATTGEIVAMFCRRYGWLSLISFACAAPVAFIIGESTLKHFPEHTPMVWWVFPLSLLLVSGFILGIVALQSWRTARENPANSIKTE